MTTTKTILGDQWIVNGSVSANFHLAAFDDAGNELMRSNPHTVTLVPDADLAAALSAVNVDITTRNGLKWPAIDPADWGRITAHCSIEHTPAVVAAYEQFKAAQSAALESDDAAVIAVNLAANVKQ